MNRSSSIAAFSTDAPKETIARSYMQLLRLRQLVGRFLGSNRMLAGTEVVKCPSEMRAWSLSTKVLL
jgi:hypothetical protein